MTTGFKVGATDLDSIFQARDGATPLAGTTGFKVGTQDLNDRYVNLSVGGSSPAATGFKVGTSDLNTIFAAAGTYSPVPTVFFSAASFNMLSNSQSSDGTDATARQDGNITASGAQAIGYRGGWGVSPNTSTWLSPAATPSSTTVFQFNHYRNSLSGTYDWYGTQYQAVHHANTTTFTNMTQTTSNILNYPRSITGYLAQSVASTETITIREIGNTSNSDSIVFDPNVVITQGYVSPVFAQSSINVGAAGLTFLGATGSCAAVTFGYSSTYKGVVRSSSNNNNININTAWDGVSFNWADTPASVIGSEFQFRMTSSTLLGNYANNTWHGFAGSTPYYYIRQSSVGSTLGTGTFEIRRVNNNAIIDSLSVTLSASLEN